MSLSTRLKLCSEERPGIRVVRQWETEPQKRACVPLTETQNLLQHPELSPVRDKAGKEGAGSFHTDIVRCYKHK